MKWKHILFLTAIIFLTACGNVGSEEQDNKEQTEMKEVKTVVSFQNLDVTTEENQFHVVGQVTATEGEFFYVLEYKGEEITEEKVVTVESGPHGFSDFDIMGELPDETIEGEEAPILRLYGKSSDGDVVNPNYVPIDVG